METDKDKINDPARDNLSDADRYIQSKLYEQAQSYAETRVESKKLNATRATSRKKIADMGFRTDAYQTAIRIVKDLSSGERADFIRDLNMIIKVLGKRQAELFPEEALKAAKREEAKKAENRTKTKAEKDAKSDANPRSNPAKGGAGKKIGILAAKVESPAPAAGRPTEAELTAAAEQAAGDAALTAGLPETKKAQSAISAERLADAGI